MLNQFAVWLDKSITEKKPSVIVYESVFINFRRVTSMRLSEMRGVLEMTAKARKLDIFEVNNKTWKKHFTGKGNAEKHQTIWMCRQRGWAPGDDNAADALGILDYAVSCFRSPHRS